MFKVPKIGDFLGAFLLVFNIGLNNEIFKSSV
jgi:hypothetical protein